LRVPRKRGAVVIGVNKTGDLPELQASASGAIKFAAWLAEQGFMVTTITDKSGQPVTVEKIKKAIKEFVEPGTFDQLVVYFSGHGYWKNDAELWLLTAAPSDANEAVNWKEAVEFAKDCGIPNVVLISDACRSIPDTPRALRVRGSIVFPNDDIRRDRSKVDQFMAAAVGTAAYEIPIGPEGEKQNAFTYCLLRAFEVPDMDMVLRLREDGQDIDVVPNRKLGPYLRREISSLLASVSITIDQRPDDEVLSDEHAYIGRAKAPGVVVAPNEKDFSLAGKRRGRRRVASRMPSANPLDNLRVIASRAFIDALNAPIEELAPQQEAVHPNGQTGHRKFDDALSTAGNMAPDAQHLGVETGFAVIGMRVVEAMTLEGDRPEISRSGDGRGTPVLLRVNPEVQASTVAVRFENGNGAALAALKGYVGHVVVDAGKIVSINYVPSPGSDRFALFAQRQAKLQRMRSAAAAAIRFGVFRINDAAAATKLAETIRIEKSVDPSLGLYAAYAYSETDAYDELESVAFFMNIDLGTDLFDVAMLARKPIHLLAGPHGLRTAPFCPMLTQGWNLLRARNIQLPPVLDEAQDDLVQAVWTTFSPMRTQAIFEAIETGELR
jgi:Caspase domain